MTKKTVAVSGALVVATGLVAFLVGYGMGSRKARLEFSHDNHSRLLIEVGRSPPLTLREVEESFDPYAMNPLPQTFSIGLPEPDNEGILGPSTGDPGVVTFGPLTATFYFDSSSDEVQSLQLTGLKGPEQWRPSTE